MRYHVVEPHSDDAFLSLHSHMVDWIRAGYKVTIHTLIPVNRRSLAEAEEYAKAIGADWVGYDGGRELRDKAGYRAIVANLREIRNFGDQMVLPLAVKHPDHLAVRRWLDVEFGGSFYYVDQPYAFTQSSSSAMTRLLEGRRVVSYLRPHSRKYKHVGIFRSQAKFFHFNPPEKLRGTFEMIVR